MDIHAPRRSTVALATAGALASTGTAYLGARNLLVGQATHVRTVIPKAWGTPPRADGVYGPGGEPAQRWRRGVPFDLHIMMFGDSTATGYGCASADEVPGVLLARGIADETGTRVRLSTKAIVGATSRGLCGQVDAMFVAGPPPDAAVILVGANDVTALNSIGPSARRLATCVRKLRARDAVVVVGTCPDFGMIPAIPQPLRSVAHQRSLQLARAQASAVKSADGAAVPLAQLLAPKFRAMPDAMFCRDRYHPSALGYALAAEHLLPALRVELAEKRGTPMPELPARPTAPTLTSEHTRRSVMSRLWRRPAPDHAPAMPTPVAAPTSG
ncbi:SGNH/GDSL hydrolase family protein [Mycobacterium bourgelatii]|uniref:SGNH/GDSL hydrolase family protein n=1 Tax=Mycobacterium bourgelatii TaxID=1273442 RepID=UPI0013D180E3|nr:SGNH/GDSL hydrolase family protein [Mycobacterium bourgelatii]MCV6975891.1 SGNH/GDSL hydrolase family protein [Mycobacterium bourgelatii]